MLSRESGLLRIAEDTYAFLRRPGWGWSNSGLIVGGGEAILIDTAYTVALTDQMLAQIAAERPGLQITRCVLTHGNGDHSYGVAALPESVELITSRACADSLDHEVRPAVLAGAMAASPEPLRSYLLEHFGQFDFSGAYLPSPDTTFKQILELELGSRRIELIETGPAHTVGDVIIHVPDVGVLYAGDIVFSEDTPLAWASVRGMLEACRTSAGTGARLIVPGHGPVVPIRFLKRVSAYFEHLFQHADRCASAGMPYYEAAASMPLASFAELGLPERRMISMAAAYRDLGFTTGDEETVERILARTAALARAQPNS
jgi:cyclase